MASKLSQVTFEWMWKIAGLDNNTQNLVAEMTLKGDVIVPDLAKKIFSIFGHLGYRSLKYWLNLEVQLHEWRSGDKPIEPERTDRLSDLDDSALRYAATLSESKQAEWRRILVRFQEDLARVEHLCQPLTYSYEQEELAQKGKLGIGHYLHASLVLWIQLKELLADLKRSSVCPLPSLTQVQLTILLPGFVKPPWATNLVILVEGSRRAKRYLGNYASLFEFQEA